jgi:predicted MPP superfamily phosphohydrolase
LTLSGHTHGGQLQLPLVGPLTTASNVPRDVAAGGLHSLDGRRLYVSRGIGVERDQAPRLRFGAPPEISIVTLR